MEKDGYWLSETPERSGHAWVRWVDDPQAHRIASISLESDLILIFNPDAVDVESYSLADFFAEGGEIYSEEVITP